MNTKSFKILMTVLITALLVAIFTLTATAAITVEDGKVVGLNANHSYKYANVTLENYSAPSYTNLASGQTQISGLTVGVWYIKNNTTGELTAVWIKDDTAQGKEERSNIGEIVAYNDGAYYAVDVYGPPTILSKNMTFKAGKWASANMYTGSGWGEYTISVGGAQHVAASYAEGYDNGTYSASDIAAEMELVNFKYAYLPKEILPVEDLYTISFNVGVRQGSFKSMIYSDDTENTLSLTKYVLYTMGSDGTVTKHTATRASAYASYNSHNLYIPTDFPNATGWVIGLEIFPYGEIPTDALSYEVSMNTNKTAYVNTIFRIEYNPDGYLTSYNFDTTSLPYQYNGANAAYINGYGDGTFKPEADITKAEVATIIAKLYNDGIVPTGGISEFADVSVNDWFGNAVIFLEARGAFDYDTSSRFEPNEAITRGELAQIIKNVTAYEATGASSFVDVSVSHPYSEAILALADSGILEGYGDKTFRPDATITRAEAVTVINRAVNLVVDDTTVTPSTLANTFTDISGHWAENQILMSANDNVKTDAHIAHNSTISQTENTIDIETSYFSFSVNKGTGIVHSMTDKQTGKSILAASATPWFVLAVTDSGAYMVPTSIELVDGRIKAVMADRTEIYIIVKETDKFISFEIDSALPYGISSVKFANLVVNTDVSTHRLSGVSMTANVDCVNMPGGMTKSTTALAYRKFGTIGAKFGIAYSAIGVDMATGTHVQCLRAINDAIDPTKGTTSTKGGAYALAVDDFDHDYVILSSGLNPSTAQTIATELKSYNITMIDIHQNKTNTFRQADFNFVSAKQGSETFTTAAQFKSRIGDILHSNGVEYSLHTFSSLVDPYAESIVADPEWQKQLMYAEVLTLETAVGTDNTSFYTEDDASGLTLVGMNTNGTTSSIAYNGPYSGYFLIDDEIVLVTSTSVDGLTTVQRGQLGTTAASHEAGAQIRHLLCWYTMFQPIPGSELFYHVAELTAQAYNEGGFDMIYLDGLESFAKFNGFNGYTSEDAWYYYSTFVQKLVSSCDTSPHIEGSVFNANFWNARGRGGAWDSGVRAMKNFVYNHSTANNKGYINNFLTATLGWFNFSPDKQETYKNTFKKAFFRDGIEYKGAMSIAFDMSTCANGYSYDTRPNALYSSFQRYKTLENNIKYNGLFSRLRQEDYFDENVKNILKEGLLAGNEYKLVKYNGGYAFRQAEYHENRVFDMTNYKTGSANNPFGSQTPYVRVEQRYSTLGADADAITLLDSYAFTEGDTYKDFSIGTTNLVGKESFKVNVTGNGKAGSAILLSVLRKDGNAVDERLDFFIPTDFVGIREVVLMDADNDDYEGYDFAGDELGNGNHATYRGTFTFNNPNALRIAFSGDCTGVSIADFNAYTPENTPVVNPLVTVGATKVTFNTTLRSGEYVEYLPELNKAFKHSYGVTAAGNNHEQTVEEITFTGSLTVPSGDYTYTYGYTSTTSLAPVRANVVIGLLDYSNIIANETTKMLPDGIDGLYYITLDGAYVE